MAFPNIKTDEPKGSDRVSTIDDRERETRSWLVQSLQQITGYPDCPYIKIGRWAQNNRPTNPMTNVFGYNTTSKRLEYWTGSAWESLQVDATGVNVDSATHAGSADTATKAQKDWQNDDIHTKYLKLAGGTMTGGLVVANSSPTVDAKTTALTRGTNPGSNVSRSPFTIKDNANNYLSAINKYVDTTGASWTYLVDYDHQDGTQHYIGVGHDRSGNWKTYAPTPASGSNDTSVATTAFVTSLVNTTFNRTLDWVVAESIGANGYVKFNSGLIICWGSAAQQNVSGYNYSRQINLPISMTTAVYYSPDGTFALPEQPYGYGYGGTAPTWSLSTTTSKITQTLNQYYTPDGEGYPTPTYLTYFPAFKYIVIGK